MKNTIMPVDKAVAVSLHDGNSLSQEWNELAV